MPDSPGWACASAVTPAPSRVAAVSRKAVDAVRCAGGGSEAQPAIAAAMARLVSNPEMAREVGRAGRALVQERFGWERAAERLEAAYTRALALKSLPS